MITSSAKPARTSFSGILVEEVEGCAKYCRLQSGPCLLAQRSGKPDDLHPQLYFSTMSFPTMRKLSAFSLNLHYTKLVLMASHIAFASIQFL
ncbi:hypothetical protein Tco_1534060 [Tanacetum coccineum]